MSASTSVLPTLCLCSEAFQSLLMPASVKRQLATTQVAKMVFLRDCLRHDAAQPQHFTTTISIWFDALMLSALGYHIECILHSITLKCLLLIFFIHTLKLAFISCRTVCSGTHFPTVWKLWHECAATPQSCLLVEYLTWPTFFPNSRKSVRFREDGETEDYEKIRCTCLLSVAENVSAWSASGKLPQRASCQQSHLRI